MATAAEQLETHPHIQTIRRYYQACTAGDVDGVAACCTDDVVHYCLAPGTKPVQGNEHLGRYWRKIVQLVAAEWRVEHAMACDDEAVIEWSMQWTSGDDRQRYIIHGAEWYVFLGELISEIRAYYRQGVSEDTALVGFPYAERGYTTIRRSASDDIPATDSGQQPTRHKSPGCGSRPFL
jgi:SnoaL-like domain